MYSTPTLPVTKMRPQQIGFTLVEVMIAMVILTMVVAMSLSQFLYCMRMMYRDNARAETNANLRNFTSNITRQTLDASEFYLFDYYTKLDGTVNLATDVATLTAGTDEIYDANGDCLVLITKTTEQTPVKIRRLRIYYRLTTDQTTQNTDAPLLFYDSGDWGDTTANTHLYSDKTAIIDAINLNSTPTLAGSSEVYPRTRGRKKSTSTDLYPMFSSSSPSPSSASDSTVSINVEFLNGTNASGQKLLSSSSFNYTISPRR